MDERRVGELVEEIYAELKRQAARLVTRARGQPTPTSLVHETVLRLYRQAPERWADERHFRATAALALKQVLIDSARRATADKRGGPAAEHITLADIGTMGRQFDVVVIGQVLDALESGSPRTAKVVALKLLGELENEEIATALEISRATVDREWRAARALLQTWGTEG
jgi:RNA polymerase sigma factor (TIGR02999 family)